MVKHHICFLFLLTSLQLHGQFVEWAFDFGGKENDYCNSMVVDSDTSFIAVGYFQDTVSFDPFSSDYIVSNYSLFIAKYRNDKKLIWLKTIEKASASLIKLDKNGDIFVSGSFRSNVDFDPGPGQFILPHSGAFKSDFLLKLDKHGNFIWVKNVVRGSNVSHIYDFYFDINEDIILTGSIRSPADFDPGPGIFELSGLWDRTSSFVSKLDKNGNFKWAGLFRNVDTGSYDNYGFQIHTDNNANIYIVGLFGGRVDFNPGPATYFVNKPNTYQTYIVKLSPDRQFLWVKFYPLHISSYTKNSFILSPDENYFYLAGTFRNTIDVVTIQGQVSLTSNGDSDFCIYKIDMAGDIHFIKQWGSAEFDSYTHMHFDRNQDLVVAGGTSGVLSLDNNTTIIPKRPYENFICTFDVNDFSVKQALSFSRASIYELASTYSNDILVCGLFSDTLETYQLPILLTSAGRFVFDGFILKISECQLPLEEIIYETICKQETYNYFGTDKSESGIYEHKIKNQAGCDSIIYQLNLTVLEKAFSDEFVETCIPHTWNGTTYDQSGIYTYQTISTNGCDSIATLDLTIHHSTESVTVIASCDTYDWNGQTYLQSGEYTFQTQNVHGCDSIANLFLTITPSYLDTSFITTCDDYFWSGSTHNQSGTYSWSGQTTTGCDSISTLVLTIQNTIQTQINITACDQYDWNGSMYTQSGVYTYQTTSSSGCDSIVTLYLEVFPSVMTQENISACDSFMWQNQILTTSGTYTHQEMTLQGCDSTKQLFLTILPSTTSQVQINACESFDWNGQTYTSSGLYTYQTNNHAGCDSTAFLELTIHPKVNETVNVTSCYSYEWNGETYTQSGHYSITRLNQFGCDSTTTLQLTIHPSYQNVLSLSACTEVVYQNNTYTSSGLYEVVLQSEFGCDSIINLTININAQSFEESQSACDSLYWPQSQEQYHESGIYEAVFMNAQGCDSTYQLTLEILPSYRQSEVREVCETYTWPNNQQTYTQSGIYTIQRQTQRGCDSIQSLDLTIYEGFRKRDTIIADSSYTWPVNGITYETSGAYEERYTNGEGCDSIHYLVLRIESTYTIQFPNIITGGTNTNLFKGFSSHDNVVLKELSIYDRMASRVYHVENTKINDPNYGWNGTFRGMEVVPGVYVWMAEVLLPDGSIKQMTGDVTIIR